MQVSPLQFIRLADELPVAMTSLGMPRRRELAGLLVLVRVRLGQVLFLNHHVAKLFGVKHFSAEFTFHELSVLVTGNDADARVFARGLHRA
jgi:hypothetical protein